MPPVLDLRPNELPPILSLTTGLPLILDKFGSDVSSL